MSRKVCFVALVGSLFGSLAMAGTIIYDPPERTLANADLVAIATQAKWVGSVGGRQQGADNALFVADFEIKLVLKGAIAEKRIRVLSNRHRSPSVIFPDGEAINIGQGETAVLHLTRLDSPAAHGANWQLLGAIGAARTVAPEDIDSAAKEIAETLLRLKAFKQKALQEMEAIDPAALQEAKGLLPELVKARREIAAVVARESANRDQPDDLPFSERVWRSLEGRVPERLRKAGLRALRALGISAYLDHPDAQGLRWFLDKRVSALTEAEKAAVKAWLRRHWPQIREPQALDAFADANPGYVARFYGEFPPDAIWPSDFQLKPDPETAHTLRFLMDAEDPGHYNLHMGAMVADVNRALRLGRGQKLEPVLGAMRVPWIKDTVLAWLGLGSDSILLKPALIVMNENPGAWTRAWIEAERKAGNANRLPLLAGPAAGLDDPDLVCNLWLDIVRRGADEQMFCRAVAFFQYFHPKVASLAVDRWKANVEEAHKAGKDVRDAGWSFQRYLGDYRTFAHGSHEEFETPEHAAEWLRATFPHQRRKGEQP